MNYNLPNDIKMQCVWIVRVYERIMEQDKPAPAAFRQAQAVDRALDLVAEESPQELRDQVRRALFLSWQEGDRMENIDKGMPTGRFYKTRQRVLYEIAAELGLVSDNGRF